MVDEPISQLDPQNAQIVYEKLTLLNRELGKTILVIEHHPEFIGAYCDSVVLLKAGQVVWKRPVAEALSRVDELIANDIYPPQVTRIAHELNGHAAATYPVTLDAGTRYLKQWLEQRGRAQATISQPVPPVTTPSAQPLVTFQNISHSYKTLDGGRKPVLQDVYLNFHPGERVALVGANGAGKSTLLKMITGLVRPQEGRVHVSGQDARTQSPEKLANHVALIYQDPQQMFIEDSIRGDVGFFLKERKVADMEAIVAKAVEDFRLQEIYERDGRLLSGGQMRRASLAIGACMRPQIMLLDEPTSSLDVADRRQIAVMLRKLETWVRLVMIATHDMELVAEWATRVVVLQRGRVIADGTPEEIFGNPNLLDKARIRLPQVVRLSHALKLQPVRLSVEDFVAYLSDQTATT
ncbi:MAG: ATP-binding cassette domain-containing protein [Candidatus Promineifilaceae bacterium]